MKEKVTNFVKTPLITSILLFILGAILFTNPQNIVMIVTYGFGGLFILSGFIRLANYLGDKKKEIANNNDLIYALVLMVLGIVIILCTSMIELLLRIIMGGFILYNGILRMISALKMREFEGSIWKGSLIVAIIMILVGLYIILKSNLVFSGIGLFIMVYSVLEIVSSIMTYNNDKLVIKK